MVELLELGAGPLSQVLKLLPSVQDLCRCRMVCRALHHAVQDDTVWQAKALELYPAETELVQDDNCEHAALFLPLVGRSCRYKMNQPHYFFECLMLGLEWNRAEHTFRLYIDARGEVDLRQPGESSMGFMVHRGGAPDRSAMRERLLELEARRQEVLRQLAAAQATDCVSAVARVEHQLARCEGQMQQVTLDLARHLELSFADLLTVVRPSGPPLLGYLEFDSLNKIDVLLRELPDSYASKQHAVAHGVDLCFCYANPIPVMPHGALVDYEPAVVVTVPPGASLLSVFKAAGRYVAPGQGLQELEQEGPEARLQRWDHLPLEVMARQPPWLV
ncbi:hypothetical protein CHLNCDRAFT_141219 [Chlorella variabilis]|uniref:F-box domain-containing protein n=1 Tax=Chlorella variabilis TaxID=554065 RepID=E1ZSC7_CHLVA|nr:hypothetical protein CHLNCDRAFT_141219 [Chlorella variabilis]EFN51283.1 hypothetical protein CHLNCDRAFT_141219 [Chlorella variabilis]|eukprot:XP_005843385.1 hypothetical protein CHLNCDRAFT_141219 [Chlorella variabilis]